MRPLPVMRGETSEGGIATLTSGTFDTFILDGQGPIAVEFMTYSCAHCGTIEPVLQQAAEALRSKEQVFRVNIATEQDLAQRFDIQATPTIVLFMNGREVGRVEGPSPNLSSVLAELTQPFEG